MPGQYVVLVVEDQEIVQRTYARVLSVLDGIGIVAKTHGHEAVSYFADGGQADIVILDLSLPDMSGVEVLEHMVANGRSMPPVIIASSEAGSVAALPLVTQHTVALLQKPFDYHELVDLIRRKFSLSG